MKLLSVGTSWICAKFLEAVTQTNTFEIYKTYSRHEKTSLEFSKDFNSLPVFGDLELVLQDELIDVVYLASPTFKHYDDILLCLQYNKHIICEKPLVLTYKQYKDVKKIAYAKDLILFEAMRTINLPQLDLLKAWLFNKEIKEVYLEFGKISSKYNAFLNNENPTTFMPTLNGGGAMYDLGIYSLNLAVSLFGKPNNVSSKFEMLENNCDGESLVVLDYRDFKVSCFQSKVKDYDCISYIILNENEKILINTCSSLHHLQYFKNDVLVQEFKSSGNDMIYEVNNFYAAINLKDVSFNDEVANSVYEIIDGMIHDL